MAGWIKWSKGLPSKPEVIRLARLVDRPRDTVVVSLMRFWEWTDDSIGEEDIQPDGCGVIVLSPIRGDNVITIDDIAGVPGFAEGLIAVGWLRLVDDRLELPNFGRHNGETAKTRARNSKSQQRKRQGNGGVSEAESTEPGAEAVTNLSPFNGDISMTRGEERRVLEERTPPPPDDGGSLVVPIPSADQKTRSPKTRPRPPKEPAFDPLTADLPHKSPAFAAVWADWCQHRREKKPKEPLGPTAVKTQLKKLAKLSEAEAIRIVEKAIGGNWAGIYLDDEPSGQATATTTRPGQRAEPGRGSADDPAFLAASGLDPLPVRRGGAA